MVDHDDKENISLLRFNALWEANYRHDSLLVFSTERSPTLYKELRKEKPMLNPDITIMSVGTEITYGDAMVPDNGWEQFLNQKWDRNVIREEASKLSELKLQAGAATTQVSFDVVKAISQKVMEALSERLAKLGLDVKIIYSGGIDLPQVNILPQGAGKGLALAYLPTKTLACGDSDNDAELFSIPEVFGCMVSNAHKELLQWHAENAKNNPNIHHPTERCAAGIIQTIGQFELGPNVSLRDIKDISKCSLENTHPGFEIVKFYLFYKRWRRAEIVYCEQDIQNLQDILVRTLHDCVSELTTCYGDKKGKQFRVYVDRVSSAQVCPNSWLVKFYKCEISEKTKCSSTTATKAEQPACSEYEDLWYHIKKMRGGRSQLKLAILSYEF
ncbi:hypothetical protein MKW94_005513 [Papaver nudicaule]|uniref:Sucrose-phosphatase n=1 Tax=Papaver nudicaule TaxID=74823 RepID=A0AA42AYV0_PAPNU|nr:hypothetical protein [Papaver nudicaule]